MSITNQNNARRLYFVPLVAMVRPVEALYIYGVNRMQIRVTSTLNAPAEQVWATLQESHTLQFVAQGVISYKNEANFPEYWQVGTRINVQPVLFGLLPQGDHWVEFVEIDEQTMTMRTQEKSPAVERWNHTMLVRTVSDTACEYIDLIDIEAGAKTFLVTVFAYFFYRHRHRRWSKLLAQ